MIIGGKSNKEWTWTCARNHDWTAPVSRRTNGSGCSQCSDGTSKVEQALIRVCGNALSFVQGGAKVSVHWRKSRVMTLDLVGDFQGQCIAVEYDGSYYHSSPASMARDTDKTLALLAAGYWVVRIRDCGLRHLNIEHPGLLQIDHPYRFGLADRLQADLAPRVAEIMAWCTGR
jgi:hypothetical protein